MGTEDGFHDKVHKLRYGIEELKGQFDPKAAQSYTFILMAQVFYEIEAAIDAGATQRSVCEVFRCNGVPLPFTRFVQDLTRLRTLFPPRKQPPQLDPQLVQTVGSGLAHLADMSANDGSETVPSNLCTSKLAERSSKPVRKARRMTKSTPRPVLERMQVCAEQLIELARNPHADISLIQDQLRSSLGNGWTLKTAIQFIVGSQYAEWLDVPGLDRQTKYTLITAQALALRLMRKDRTFQT